MSNSLPTPDLNALKEFDRADPQLLRPTLETLTAAHADRFDPVRFRLIQALTRKAAEQRPAVARVVEKKALRALSDFLDAYLADRESVAAPAVRRRGEERKQLSPLAALSRELEQRGKPGSSASPPSFEEELRRQEWEIVQSVSGFTPDAAAGTGAESEDPSRTGAMHYLRESMVQRSSQRRVEHAIQDRPENPGPLNAQALITRTLGMMRDISPSYANRYVAYMETLLWLEQAGRAAAPAKGKGKRKSHASGKTKKG